eukprot:5301713-Prymnesium_polylepis.3
MGNRDLKTQRAGHSAECRHAVLGSNPRMAYSTQACGTSRAAPTRTPTLCNPPTERRWPGSGAFRSLSAAHLD